MQNFIFKNLQNGSLLPVCATLSIEVPRLAFVCFGVSTSLHTAKANGPIFAQNTSNDAFPANDVSFVGRENKY